MNSREIQVQTAMGAVESGGSTPVTATIDEMASRARVSPPKMLSRPAISTRRIRQNNHASVAPLSARRHPFVAEVERGLRRCLLETGGELNSPLSIVIGVSGGADSVALLLALLVMARHRRGLALTLTAVHVHHHLRDSADADARFVAKLCDKFNVPYRAVDIYPGRLRGNVSANARRLRYEALGAIAIEIGASFVAVAHHGEDQLETMIAALGRGAGLDGLAGMPWARPLEKSVALIRPLLGVRRGDCEAFCRAAGVKGRDDPSNVDATKRRARIRRDVLPVLEELFPDAARRATATADLVRAARAALEAHLDECFGVADGRRWDRQLLQLLPIPLIAAGIRRCALHLAPAIGDELNQRHLMLAAEQIRSCDRSPHRYDWPGELRLSVSAKVVTLTRVALAPEKSQK